MNAKGEAETVELLKGASVVFSGHLVGKALSFLYHLLLARLLGPIEYGVFLLGLALFSFAALVADLGLRWGVLRESAAAAGRGESAIVKGTILGGALFALGGSLLGAVGLLLVRGGAAASFKASDLGWLLPLFAVALPFATLGTISMSGLQALKRMGALSAIQYLLDPVLRIVTFTGLVLLGERLFAAAASHLLTSVAVALVGFLWLSASFPLFSRALRPHFSPGSLLDFSLPLLMSNVVGFVLQWADTLLLGYYLTAGEVGLYGTAGRLAGLGAMFLTAVGAIFAPKIYALYGRGDLAEVGRLYRRSTRWILMLAMPLFLYTALNAESLLALFGSEFVKGAPALLILAAATLVMTGTGPAGDVVLMVGKSKAALSTSAASGALGVGLNAYLIPRLGLPGAALATGLALASGNLANVLMAWRFTGLQPYTRAMAKPILLACVVAALQAVVGPFLGGAPVVRLVVAAGVWLLYPLLLWRLGLTAEDRAVWRFVKESKACAGSSGS